MWVKCTSWLTATNSLSTPVRSGQQSRPAERTKWNFNVIIRLSAGGPLDSPSCGNTWIIVQSGRKKKVVMHPSNFTRSQILSCWNFWGKRGGRGFIWLEHPVLTSMEQQFLHLPFNATATGSIKKVLKSRAESRHSGGRSRALPLAETTGERPGCQSRDQPAVH